MTAAKGTENNVLLGPRDIEKHALETARKHIVGEPVKFPKWLVKRLGSSYREILEVYRKVSREPLGGPVSPEAEWLLDNFYIIEEQLKEIKLNLSRRDFAWLPALKNEPVKGYPRIYSLALELVAHTDGSIDEKTILNFVRAYKSEHPLYMTELWALAVMLRIALIEKTSRICQDVDVHLQLGKEAERLADLIITAAEKSEIDAKKLIDEQIQNNPNYNPLFIGHLIQVLRKKGTKTAALTGYIDEKLGKTGTSLEALMNQAHRVQAARQVSIGNSITSLRMVAAIDWSEIFESLSLVEEMLRQDPSGCYNQMDFESRDHYRHVIEKMSRFYAVSEIEVTSKALECAQKADTETDWDPVRHVGYYLISSGRETLERQLGFKPRGLKAALSFLRGYPHLVYFSSIALTSLVIMSYFLSYAANWGYAAYQGAVVPVLLLLTGLILVIPVSDIAINLVHFAVSHIYTPTVLPKLELKWGISREHSAMVIIPTLLPNEKRVKELLEKLEVYYLANKETNLYFALVGDFKDGPDEETADDFKIVNSALKGINELNHQYAKGQPIFYYFNRHRKFNEVQQHWMGWERKRGAILEFNDLLRGSKDTSFSVLSCEIDQLPWTKYIITLDADTTLPRGAARKLIGTMAHPLNTPEIDRQRGIVVKGHGILQPRIGVSIDSANKTFFSRIFAGQGGIDPYTTAVSDVYQDLFGEGIFTGKGIYELDTFQYLLKEAVPENCVLSHDLLEGSYVRAGLVTDIEFIDGYPARYNSFSMRLHRWVRGDWQLVPWLKTRVRNSRGEWRENPLTIVSKWKIIDNLRRSLLNPALFLLVNLGFFILPGSSLVWLSLAVLTVAFPILTNLAGGILTRIEGGHGQTVITGLRASSYQAALQFSFIPYQAFLMIDAMARTLVRLFITRKNLLEWIPAADLEALLRNDLPTFFKKMFISPLLGVLVLALAILKPGSVFEISMAVLVLGVWAAAPYVAFAVSLDYVKKIDRLDAAEQAELRRLSRKTWAYFEELVTAKDNHLPPDNFQVDPPNGIAHRTSPTNIGLLLISTLAARDLGYLSTTDMIRRLNATLSTVEQMEKWEGHLYNWYNTLNLKVLRPRYISTVDSGNFVGYLMVLEEGLKNYVHGPIDERTFARGLIETARLYNEEIDNKNWLVETRILEEFVAGGEENTNPWPDVLHSFQAKLSGEETKAKIEASPWGKKLLALTHSLQKETTISSDNVKDKGEELIRRTRSLIDNTRFTPLFDSKRQLFSIGYNVEEGSLTKSYYDLLASEARLASYIAIARGEVDQKHWFRLGRKLTKVDGYKGLVSWAGTMFEYFMPLLVMRNFENSLLDATYAFVVKAQTAYGQKRKIPWGVSESAYFAFDIDMNYQYKAFGVPELGFKRGLGNELVIAPYATVLALTTNPKEAARNVIRLKEDGIDGNYGFFEAVDYTPVRAALHGNRAVVKNFMAHHQGMSLVALNNYLNDDIMQKRFHANPVIKSAELLLQERMPYKVSIVKEHKEEYNLQKRKLQEAPEVIRKYGVPESRLPQVHLLSNGSYSVMVTDGGSGYSKVGDMAVARWKENFRGNSSGFLIYIQNINSNNVWSAGFEPYCVVPEDYQVVFSPDKAEFFRSDGNIETHTQIVVSPEDNCEIRTVTLTNNSQHFRVLEITSYMETVLTRPEDDLAHPAFSNLFVTSEFVPQYDCLLAVRRPRSAAQKPVFALHTVSVEGEVIGDLQYETDRAKFIGRNRNLGDPMAMDVDQPLSNSTGAVLDPIMSLRVRVKVPPEHSVRISYAVAVTDNRKRALVLADKYRDPKAVARAFEMAWNRSRIEAGYLNIKAEDLVTYLSMVPSILFLGPARRRFEESIALNRKGQPCLWPFGISGDMPLILVHVSDKAQIELVQSLLKAHEFWRMKGLKVDLVFWAEDENGYGQPLQETVREAIFLSHARDMVNRMGGVFLLNANQMEKEDQNLLYASARIILQGSAGPVEDQLIWPEEKPDIPEIGPGLDQLCEPEELWEAFKSLRADLPKLTFDNGIGGFSPDGTEYVIHLRDKQHTPAPWINVIANPRFGFNISEAGGGYTWAENSRENKLTPWSNDPVQDVLGEAFYLRDEKSGDYWSITPMPVREQEDYTIRHGQGFTVFEHLSHGVEQQLTEFVALEEPVKICLISLKNLSRQPRELSVTYYMRPILGVSEKVNAQYVTSQNYGEKGLLLISNYYNCDFPGRIAFIDTSEVKRSLTGDDYEFIGQKGSLQRPAAMSRESLSGTVGAGLAPCGAMQVKVRLEPKETKEVVFLLGQGKDLAEALVVADRFNKPAGAQAELARVKAFWAEKLQIIQVSTPDKAMDLLFNGWLQYQVVSCRLWSRAAFYQSGGALGFRDQLQDVMALAYTWPELTREQILLHSAHQFLEGDVQHWWHPEANKGIRTRYSDDYLWLPYVTADYIKCTGDWSILDETTGYLEDDPLPVHEDERYNIPRISEEKDTLFAHCTKALDRALRFGAHGLPLMGSGDWNDGMNNVGHQGKGESIWLGWFLYTVLQKFIPICKALSDDIRVEKYSQAADSIVEAIEQNGWDGSWYRRAYFDDGNPLGSAQNTECKIDSLAQSWSVISGVARPRRSEEAMKAVENYLVDREAGIIKLLAPPFGEGPLEPGYIKGYVPGVRENGGQYTHAAIWTILAFAKMGSGDKAGELFSLINPINHALTVVDVMRYKVEPYVLAADVYAVYPNTGRGGWSWYTGAAGWMYRVGIESILGLRKVGDRLYFDPCIPKDWPEYKIEYRLPHTVYMFDIQNPSRVNKGVVKVIHDGQEVPEGYISLTDDGKDHQIQLIMGNPGVISPTEGERTENGESRKKGACTHLPVSASTRKLKV